MHGTPHALDYSSTPKGMWACKTLTGEQLCTRLAGGRAAKNVGLSFLAGAEVNVVDYWSRTPLSTSPNRQAQKRHSCCSRKGVKKLMLTVQMVMAPVLTAVEAKFHKILGVLSRSISDRSLSRRTRSTANLLHVAVKSGDTDTFWHGLVTLHWAYPVPQTCIT